MSAVEPWLGRAGQFIPAWYATPTFLAVIASQMATTLVAALPVGAFTGWLSWQPGLILRGTAR